MISKIVNKIFRRIEVTIQYFFGKLRSLFSTSRYCIKPGYRHRDQEIYCDDTGHTDEYQNEVYELARIQFEKKGYDRVLDIGCGSAYKLMKYFSDADTVGVDVERTYTFLKNKYPDRRWINAESREEIPLSADLVICSDVIEHVSDPDALLELIRKIDFKLLFISTPERDMVRGWYHYGPPDNPCHIREWNAKEFRQYISSYFDVQSHQVTNMEDATQLLICTKKM